MLLVLEWKTGDLFISGNQSIKQKLGISFQLKILKQAIGYCGMIAKRNSNFLHFKLFFSICVFFHDPSLYHRVADEEGGYFGTSFLPLPPTYTLAWRVLQRTHLCT